VQGALGVVSPAAEELEHGLGGREGQQVGVQMLTHGLVGGSDGRARRLKVADGRRQLPAAGDKGGRYRRVGPLKYEAPVTSTAS
jgi:hypothetical protein